MKKLVLSSLIAGIVYAILATIFSLFCNFVGGVFVSLINGGVIIVMMDILESHVHMKGSWRKVVLSVGTIIIVSVAIWTGFYLIWGFQLNTESIAGVWVFVGGFLYLLAQNIVKLWDKTQKDGSV